MRRMFYLKVLSVLILIILGVNTANAQSASIFFGAAPKQAKEGDRLSVDIKIQSSLQSVNAISGVLTFSENLVGVTSISREKSVINIWTREPKVVRNKISFEGVALNPGFQGSSGLVFTVNFEAKRTGTVFLSFTEGAILANDGRGTNVLAKLGSASFSILPRTVSTSTGEIYLQPGKKLPALPVITDYSPLVESKDGFYIKGKGEPSALTKIIFQDTSVKSIGERLIALLQNKKEKVDEVLLNNNTSGDFEYVSSKNLVAGVYNATPFLVDESTNTEKPGLGVQLLVDDSKIVKALVVVINILGLLIPIVLLLVIIYFIPWYSFKKMRVIKKKLGLEEEKLDLSEHQLERQDKILDDTSV